MVSEDLFSHISDIYLEVYNDSSAFSFSVSTRSLSSSQRSEFSSSSKEGDSRFIALACCDGLD